MKSYKKKTHRGAAKRFKLTATGKVKRNHACKSHLNGGKPRKQLRGLKKGSYVSRTQSALIKSVL